MKWFLSLIERFMAWLYPSEPQPTVPATVPPSPPIPQPVPEASSEPQNDDVGPVPPLPREVLYEASRAALGDDLTPRDEIDDELACVSQIQEVIRLATGSYIGSGAERYNTFAFKKALDAHAHFSKIAFEEVLPGDVVVAATGEGQGHGHCWIVGVNHWMSNSSFGANKGKWTPNYTKPAVVQTFVKQRGFTLHCYRLNQI